MSLPRTAARRAAPVLSFILLAFAGCVQPSPSADDPSTVPSVVPEPALIAIRYEACRHFLVIVEAPKEDVQRLLPDGFEPNSGINAFGSAVPTGTAGLGVEFWDCPAPLLDEVPTSASLRVLSVWASVDADEDAGPAQEGFLLEHYVDEGADGAVVAAFQAAGIPVAKAEISYDVMDAGELARATIGVTSDGAAPIQYDVFWKPNPAPAHALVYYRDPMRTHALAEGGAHVFYDDVPDEREQEAYVLPHTLRVQGGVLGRVGTGAAGHLAGHGMPTVVEGTWKLTRLP